MRLYTITMQTENLEIVDDPLHGSSVKDKKAIRDKMRKDMFARLFNGTLTTWQEFESDGDF
jgi:hypothetical protein